jgi:hypothetical protein
MPLTNPSDPVRTSQHDPGAAMPGSDATTDLAPGSAGVGRDIAASRPGEVPESSGTEPDCASGSVSVPGYEILGILGRGGMGVVYKARHLALKRTVALKMVLAGGHASPQELARFRLEAEAVARLQHPNIVQIHEVGEANGHPYCALEFVEGGSLASKLKGQPLLAREAARLVEALARAVQLAHSRNVVHRDLKPANVLLLADGTPKITDFGLARQLDSDSGETQAGQVMGTPSYMAPEQAAGSSHEAGPAADVYALGAILYECLAGRPPFRGKTVVETLDQVRTQEPPPPSRFQAGVPLDLETICLKCLRKEPENRYASAAELADDLGRFVQGEPIQARPVGGLERLAKWVRRRPAIAALTTAMFLVALTAAAVGVWALDSTSRAYRDAIQDRDRANKALLREQEALAAKQALVEKQKLLLSEAARAYAEVSERDLEKGHVQDSLNWMLQAYLIAPEDDPRRLEYRRWIAVQGQMHGRPLSPNGLVNWVAFSPDGRSALTGGWENRAQLWEVASGKLLATLPHGKGVREGAFSQDGRTALTGSYDNTARLWEVPSGKPLATFRHELGVVGQTSVGQVNAVALSPDGRTVLTGGVDNKTARLWEVPSGKLLAALPHNPQVNAVAFSPDGRTALTGGVDRTARLWEVPSGKLLATFPHEYGVFAVAFAPDGRTVLTGTGLNTNKGEARLWKVIDRPAPDQPVRVRAWVRVRSAKGFDRSGALRCLTAAEQEEAVRELEANGGDWEKAQGADD